MSLTTPARTLLASLALALVGPALAADAIRIRAGTTQDHTDESGVVWLADQGFSGGDTIDRTGLKVAKTSTPSIYTTERYGMGGFSRALANGKYTVKLHFAETYEGIYGKGERVFSFNVEGKEFKDFDVTARAGAVLTAYVETVEVEVTDGKLDITFTSQIENPEINALEIIPAG
ncbi:Di-glucose binding within endoplasmic reticulum [Lacunisphaera limnophila]|uniref:Di-glucose binding within endoplasmic reticulum n=1 Tax=Lacunisphaera limnophila TaxID=1838286 RepID=A0A1I7PHX3_9BACT|nr:malectin [Lacunisphaera limnophila]AOS43221.1 Di-glucose binding within endoplasmic reticulum [Lacunisphaera limnophila]